MRKSTLLKKLAPYMVLKKSTSISETYTCTLDNVVEMALYRYRLEFKIGEHSHITYSYGDIENVEVIDRGLCINFRNKLNDFMHSSVYLKRDWTEEEWEQLTKKWQEEVGADDK